MSDDTPERIKGAKLVNGTWQDLDGNPLTNADLIRLRDAEARDKEERAKAKKDAVQE